MSGIFVRTVPAVMENFGCSAETAQRYMDLRDEGYGPEQALLMAGLSDPPEPDAEASSLPLQDIELPGMWELSDFMGGQDEVRGAACEARAGAGPKDKP